MPSFAEPIRSRSVSRLAIMVALAAGLAGCGSDFTRMNENPWTSRPQAQAPAAQPEYTGSVRPHPSSRVDSQPLAAPGQAAPQQYAQQPTYGGGAGVAPIQPQRPEYTGSVSAPPPRQPSPPQQSWSWDGGTAVIVAQGETLSSISRRHGVPVAAIMQANKMGPASQVRPGQRLVIPRVQHQMGQAPIVTAPKTRVAGPLPAAGGNVHVAQPGETIYSLARRYQLTPMAIAKANNVGLAHQLKVGERVTIPGGTGSAPRIASAAPQQYAPAPVQPPRQNVAAAQPASPPVSKQSPKIAQVEPAASARVVTPAADPAPEPQTTSSTPSANASGTPSFRWPVKGRVIEAFGKKGNGQQNDGINVAVPEGTPIKAAEDGVVAYAGNELKGFGNLVLVRHQNGYVTAYAHASELSVKKGETIKRGQVIGKAGATGNVQSPQLHFEVRRGATPVDPAQYLTGG
jgi:murein DD-endopeptidase MepM/ murein hydrolase activator NlpD